MPRPYFQLIMPFGSDTQAKTKQAVIREVAGAYGIDAHFPTYDKSIPTIDLASVMENFKGSAFVLADLTLQRPSCYYELGIAEALGKKTFVIAEEGTDVHQTASRKFVHFYRDLDQLKNVARAIMEEATATELNLYSGGHGD